MRLAAWGLLNIELSDRLLTFVGANARPLLSATAAFSTVSLWGRFCRWLRSRGCRQWAEVSEAHYEDFARHLAEDRLIAEVTARSYLTALARLWTLGLVLPELRTAGMPPWIEDGPEDYLPLSAGGETSRPISPDVMASLLAWSLVMVEECSDTIIAAHETDLQVKRWTRTSRNEQVTPKAWLEGWLQAVQAAELPLPTLPGAFGREVSAAAVSRALHIGYGSVDRLFKAHPTASYLEHSLHSWAAQCSNLADMTVGASSDASSADAGLAMLKRAVAAGLRMPIRHMTTGPEVDVDFVAAALSIAPADVREWCDGGGLAAGAEGDPLVEVLGRWTDIDAGRRASGRQRLRVWYAAERAAGRPLPTKMHAGTLVFDHSMIAFKAQVPANIVHQWIYEPTVETGPARSSFSLHQVNDVAASGTRLLGPNFPLHETESMVRRLEAACYIVICYLTGMRPGEVLALEQGCLSPSTTSGGWALIRSRHFKNVRDENGVHDSRGSIRQAPWVAITPVSRALAVLERLCDSGSLLFATRNPHGQDRSGRSRGPTTITDSILDMIDWVNGRIPGAIDDDPRGRITPRRFRRTLAWHIANQPNGVVALAIQYGHVHTAISEGYASQLADGIEGLIDLESARTIARNLMSVWERLRAGERVSGPAAGRLITAAKAQSDRYGGIVVDKRQAKKLHGDPTQAAYQNDDALVWCMFRRATALCLTAAERDATDARPHTGKCRTTCSNIAMSDSLAEAQQEEIARLELEASVSPLYLAQRLQSEADKLRQTTQCHLNTRTIAAMEVDDER